MNMHSGAGVIEKYRTSNDAIWYCSARMRASWSAICKTKAKQKTKIRTYKNRRSGWTQHLKGMCCKVNSQVLKKSSARGVIERKKERSEILRYFQLNILRIATTTGHLRHCDCLPLSRLHRCGVRAHRCRNHRRTSTHSSSSISHSRTTEHRLYRRCSQRTSRSMLLLRLSGRRHRRRIQQLHQIRLRCLRCHSGRSHGSSRRLSSRRRSLEIRKIIICKPSTHIQDTS